MSAAAAGCTVSDGPPGPLRAVEVGDDTDDGQVSRLDGDAAPHGGLDLAGATLRDGGDVLVVELQIEDGETGSPDSAAAAVDSELVYVVHLWGGEDPDGWFTVHAMVADGAGTSAVPGDPVHVCNDVAQLGRCVDAEVEPAGAVVRTDGRFTFEVPWEALGPARTDGFDWLAGAVYTEVEGDRWDQWFDDAPGRPDPDTHRQRNRTTRGGSDRHAGRLPTARHGRVLPPTRVMSRGHPEACVRLAHGGVRRLREEGGSLQIRGGTDAGAAKWSRRGPMTRPTRQVCWRHGGGWMRDSDTSWAVPIPPTKGAAVHACDRPVVATPARGRIDPGTHVGSCRHQERREGPDPLTARQPGAHHQGAPVRRRCGWPTGRHQSVSGCKPHGRSRSPVGQVPGLHTGDGVVMRTLRVGLLGCGVVGSALMRRLDRTAMNTNKRAAGVVAVAVRDLSRDRACDLSAASVVDDPFAVVRRDDIDVVIELIGGTEPTRELVHAALDAGRAVVTANKALIGAHGPELCGTALRRRTPLLFEAAVGAGVPVLRSVSALAGGGQINRIEGVLNGTATFVLSDMERRGCDLSDALHRAQELGYAERDSSRDLEGLDAADKLAVLSQVAFGRSARTDDVQTVGIGWITPADVRQARARGRVWRLVATATAEGCLRVEPVAVPTSDSFATLDGPEVEVRVSCDYAGTVRLRGPGAGGHATAVAVLSDLADIRATVDRHGPLVGSPRTGETAGIRERRPLGDRGER